MEIILSKNIKKLSGSLCKSHGYFIRQTPEGKFVTVRKQGTIPPRGHLNTIFDIAEMTQDGFFVSDIKVQGKELNQALDEAGYYRRVFFYEPLKTYSAKDVLELIERLRR